MALEYDKVEDIHDKNFFKLAGNVSLGLLEELASEKNATGPEKVEKFSDLLYIDFAQNNENLRIIFQPMSKGASYYCERNRFFL